MRARRPERARRSGYGAIRGDPAGSANSAPPTAFWACSAFPRSLCVRLCISFGVLAWWWIHFGPQTGRIIRGLEAPERARRSGYEMIWTARPDRPTPPRRSPFGGAPIMRHGPLTTGPIWWPFLGPYALGPFGPLNWAYYLRVRPPGGRLWNDSGRPGRVGQFDAADRLWGCPDYEPWPAHSGFGLMSFFGPSNWAYYMLMRRPEHARRGCRGMSRGPLRRRRWPLSALQL